MDFKDYYDILGISPDAETPDIKVAYRKLARKYHPDLNPEADAEAKFKEVAEAWEVLKDRDRRAEYDELRRYGGQRQSDFEPPPGWQSGASGESQHFGSDFSEFFDSVFGGQFNQERPDRAGSFGFRGQDIEIEMPVFLEETITVTSKPVQYELPTVEPGKTSPTRKSLKVTIPAGVVDGQRIRLKGQGVPGQGDAPAGDLYLHVRLVPHPVFDVEGHNLVVTVPIAPWEAALGAKVTVPTLDGKINLTVAARSQSGQKLRVKGKGLLGKAGRGDLYAVLNVVMPDSASADADKLWQALAEKAAFDPRTQWENK